MLSSAESCNNDFYGVVCHLWLFFLKIPFIAEYCTSENEKDNFSFHTRISCMKKSRIIHYPGERDWKIFVIIFQFRN